MCVLLQHGLQDGQETLVLNQRAGGWWEGCGGADGERGVRRRAGEQAQQVGARRVRVGEDILWRGLSSDTGVEEWTRCSRCGGFQGGWRGVYTLVQMRLEPVPVETRGGERWGEMFLPWSSVLDIVFLKIWCVTNYFG